MPYRLGFTKPSCRTVQRIERCPEKAQFAKATLTVAEAGWGKEAGWLSTGGRNASLVIMRPARFMVGHLHWYLAVIVVCDATADADFKGLHGGGARRRVEPASVQYSAAQPDHEVPR